MLQPSLGVSTIGAWEEFALAACARLRGIRGVYLAPTLPWGFLRAALWHEIELEPDELLLAVVGRRRGPRLKVQGILTTRRLCWIEASGHPEAGPGWRRLLPGRGRRRGVQAVGYGELAEEAAAVPGPLPAVVFGDGRRMTMDGSDPALPTALAAVVNALRSAARFGTPEVAGPESPGRAVLAAVAAQSQALRRLQGETYAFAEDLHRATPRLVATPALIVICVAIYLAMVARGVSWLQPDLGALIAWGANVGPLVAVHHQEWRLFTNIFLHYGALHLALNMWCLLVSGPLVERLFGNVAFAGLYLLAGVGGSVIGLAAHPSMVSMGASGAIFGIFGGLLGFLTVHRLTLPRSVRRPLAASAIGFVAVNGVLGLLVPQIDMAAHLGGLATGYVAGLLLQRRWPSRPDRRATLRRFALAVLAAVGLAAAGHAVARHVAPPLRRQEAALAFNEFQEAIAPRVARYTAIETQMLRLWDRMQRVGVLGKAGLRNLDLQIRQAEENLRALSDLAVGHPGLRPLRDVLVRAQDAQRTALLDLRGFSTTHEPDFILGPRGFPEAAGAARRQIEVFKTRRDEFLRSQGIKAYPVPEPGPRAPTSLGGNPSTTTGPGPDRLPAR